MINDNHMGFSVFSLYRLNPNNKAFGEAILRFTTPVRHKLRAQLGKQNWNLLHKV
jgi:hypothetical protein